MQMGDILLQATTGIKLPYELGSGPAILVPTAGDNLKLLEPKAACNQTAGVHDKSPLQG